MRVLALAVVVIGCGAVALSGQSKRGVMQASFGKLADGTPIEIFTLTNANGVEMKATNYGCIITSLKIPDRTGKFADVVLGYDALEGYLKDSPYFGAVVGRYGN